MSKTRMGKRVASLLLSLVMMLSLLPTTVYATGGTGETSDVIVEETNTSDDNTVGGTTGNPELTGEDEGGGGASVSEGETATVATIGSATYESLDEAITAVADGATIVVNAGEYTLNGSLAYADKAFTIAAAEGAKVSFDMSAAVALHGAEITFNNVTFDYKTNGNYIGLQHTDTLVYNNCIINGMVFLYAVNETFNGCTFNQTSAGAYNVWTYGAQNVAFNGCTFNCVGRCVLVYNEGAVAKTDLTVENTEFNASAPAEGNAAIEIDTSLMAGGATITVDDKTTAAGFAAGSKSGSTLWNDKKQTADTNKNTTVTVAGEKVFEPKATASAVATTNDGREYAKLSEALAAVTESNPLTSVTEEAWPAATPVYYNGSFYATIGELLYDAQQQTGAIAPENAPDTAVIYCRPGTTIPTGKASHPSFVTSTTIYGNGATLSGVTEWDVENYYTLTKDITINLYSLNGGASVWGTRRSDYAVTVNMVDCKDAHEVLFNYGSGNGRVDVTVKDSTFLKSGGAAHGWPVSINCLGSLLVDGCTFDGVTTGVVVNVKQPSENGKMDVTVKNSTFNNVTGQDSNKGALRVTGQQACDIDLTIENVAFTGTHADPEDITIGNVKSAENLGKVSYNISGTDASMTTHKAGATEATKETLVSGTTYIGTNAATAAGDGTEANPYTLEQLGAMTRQEYIDAQNRLNGIMYVTVGDYAYDTNGVLGNGVRDDTTGQTPDHSKLNAYGENGYLGEKNDGANGRSVVFVGGSITSGVTGYTSIDKIGTSLLLALPAYTNVTFKGTTFNNVMSFNYQLYTSPWSQLDELKFDGCTFNGIIVGAIAAQTLTFNGCEFKNYTNTTYANSSNPTWIRPAYGNWTQGDNEGQGSDFRSLTTINFTDNKVTSTRPVKFEYISQWNITSTVTATGNSFDISKQGGDTTIKNVGLYLGAHTDANAFNLVAENNTKSENTAALYTIPEGKTSLPLGSTVKNLAGEPVELTDALKWKAGDATTDKIVLKTVEAVASVGSKQYGSLQAAIDAATAGQTVTLLTNLDLSATGLTIAKDKAVTLDLNGKTLKVANTNSGNIKVVGKLTLQDSTDTAKNGTGTGKVWTETPYISGKQDKVLVAAIDGGTFIMESGLIDAASFTADNTNEGQFAVSVQNENADATVIINGGCIKAGWYAIAGNGQDTTYNGNITVNGGILESTADYAIYHPHSGTTTINGGVVFGAAGGVSLNRGKLIVNNGIIISKGTGTTGDWGDGTGNQNAAAINVNAQYGLASVEIKGGKITAEKDAILLTNGKDGTISVSGGTFSSEVPAEYCAEGFIPTANADGTYGVELGNYVVVGGIKGFENTKFASFADAYDAIKPVLETICANDALGQGTPANADAFDAVFTDVKDGRATLTYTITGNVTYDETGYANLLTMGRRSSHYLTNERHLINFKFVGAEADRGATLTVNSNITLPYEWWGEKITTAISFENLTITGSASNGLYTYQSYFEGIDFKVNNCTLKGIKIYNCANVGGSYTITNSTLDGTGAPAGAYAIHLQGNETAPLNITISGNQISGYDRGINIDQNTAVATISGNTIGINDVNRSCIQLTQLASTKVKDNTLNLNGGNAFTLHSGLAAGSKIDIAGNTVDGNGYLIYDDTKNAIDLTYTDNTVASTVDTTKGVYGGATKALTDGVDVVINGVKAAQIGDVKYDTLQAAIDAANNGETVTLLADATEDVTIDKNITLDLGGKTLTNTGAGKATVTIAKGATATVQNGSIIGGTSYYNIQNNGTATFTDVTATAGNNDSSMIDNFGTLTIESGAYKGGLNVVKSEEGSTLTINGGKFTGTYAKGWSYNGVILSAGTTIITDGEFIQEATTPARSYPSVILAMQVEGYTSTITITGGKFTNKKSDWNIFYGWGKASSDNFEVSGGTFSKSISDGYCADGFIPTKNADGTYGVKAGKYVAQIGSKKYETLADAIRLAAKGKTITLLDNVTENVEIAANKKLTLDLNGFTLNGGTGTAKAALYNLGTITIQDTSEAKTGTIKRDDAGIEGETSYYVIRNQGTMTIESGNVINNSGYRKTNPTGSMVGSSLICNGDCDEGGTLTIKGGTFTQNNFIAIKNGVLGVLKVTGGTITSNHSAIQNWFEADITGGKITGQLWTDAWEEGKSVGKTTIGGDATFAGEIVMDITGSVAPTLAINGGNLNVTRWRITNAAAKAGAKPAVSGGTFSSAVKEEYCATGYIPTANADGTYGVKAGAYVAKVDNVKYETLQAAITAAQDTKDGATITLLTDINTSSYYEVKGENPVIIDLAGHNITGSGISGLFYVTAKGDLTIKGEGTVTAVEDNGAAMAVWVRSPIAKVTLEGGTYTQQITNTADPHFDLIYVERGNVYVEGGTYKGFTPDWTLNCYDEHYQSKEANIEVTGGTFVGFDPANNKAEGENTNFVPAGYVSTKGADGNYTVEEYKPVEVWTGYSGAKVASYATVAEAAEKLDGNKWIVIGKDYTLTEDFTIGGENLDNLYLDVAEGATLTVAEGVTLTVAANAKRLGVRDGATLVNKGTIMIEYSGYTAAYTYGFVMVQDGGTLEGELSVPAGYILGSNGNSYYAAEALFEITYSNGKVEKSGKDWNLTGATKVTLLKDVTNFARSFGSTDKLSDNFVLDLGGHTLSGKPNASGPVLDISVPMTIQNGTIKNVYKNKDPKANPGALTTSADVTIAKDAIIDGGSVGYAIWTDGYGHTLTVNGKVTSEGSYAITSNGSENGGLIAECNIIVNEGASITAPKGIAIYHPEKGTVTINGGTITGHTGVQMCSGELVINGASITSNGANMDATGSLNAILDGAAISIINRNYPGGVPTAVIKGGTFAANGKDAQTVKAYDYTGDKVAEWTAAGDNVNISGGTFSSIPTNMGVLCADGYKTVYDAYADMYNVVKQDAKITVGKRLSIGNDLTITYLVSLTDCTNPWVKFQFYNDDIKGYTTVEVKNYGTDTVTGPDGKPMDVFTFDFTGINPQRMTDTLKATVYAKDANGNVVEYQVDDYSVAQYCSNKLAKLGQNDPLRKLIGNLVAYGAAAQVYQNYRTDNLVSTVVSGAVSTDYTDRLSSVTQYTEKVLGTAGVNIKGKTLVLSNTFAVRVYFTVNEGVDIANVSFNVTANGKTDTVNSFEKDEKLGYYYFDYANLNATQLDSEVKFESFVNETGVGDMVTYSVNTYLAKKMPNYDKSSNAYKLMAEMFNYGCACTEYASK